MALVRRFIVNAGMIGAIFFGGFWYGRTDCRTERKALQEKVDIAATKIEDDASAISDLSDELAKLKEERLASLPEIDSCGLSGDRVRLIK